MDRIRRPLIRLRGPDRISTVRRRAPLAIRLGKDLAADVPKWNMFRSDLCEFAMSYPAICPLA